MCKSKVPIIYEAVNYWYFLLYRELLQILYNKMLREGARRRGNVVVLMNPHLEREFARELFVIFNKKP